MTRTKSQPSYLSRRNTSPLRSALDNESPLRSSSPQHLTLHSRPYNPDMKSVTHHIEVVQSVGNFAKELGDKDSDKGSDKYSDNDGNEVPRGSKDQPPAEKSPPFRQRFRSSEDTELQDTIKQLDSLEFSWLQPETLSKNFAPIKPARVQPHPRVEPEDGDEEKFTKLTRAGPVRESWRDKFRRNLAIYAASTSESEDQTPKRVGRFQNKPTNTFPEIVRRVVHLNRSEPDPVDDTERNLTIKPILIYTNVCKIVSCGLSCT